MLYNIVRHYFRGEVRKRIIARGYTLAEAQAHCRDPETSSATCTSAAGRRLAERCGRWFDGYEAQRRV